MEGIENIELKDIKIANQLNLRIKLPKLLKLAAIVGLYIILPITVKLKLKVLQKNLSGYQK